MKNKREFRNQIIALTCLVMSVFSAYAHAGADCSTLHASWFSHYTDDLSISWANSDFECPGNDATLAQAIYDVEKTQFTPNRSGQLPGFYNTLRHAIGKMAKVFREEDDSTCKTALAYSTSFLWINTLTLCPSYFTDQREDRASTLMHESRHLESGDPGHVTCHGGANDGDSGACDQKFTDGTRTGGGYNSDVHFLSWVVRAEVGNELSKSIAQSYINHFVPDRFNEITADQIRAFRR
jgi:hypothetical protein